MMRLDITLKNDQKHVFGEGFEHVSDMILSGLLQVPLSFPGNTV